MVLLFSFCPFYDISIRKLTGNCGVKSHINEINYLKIVSDVLTWK